MPGQGYTSPYAAAGGTMNSMERFRRMEEQAKMAGAPPAQPIAPNVPATTQPAQPGMLQGLLASLKGYFSPAQQQAMPAPQPPSQSPDQLIRAMQELNRRASQIPTQ